MRAYYASKISENMARTPEGFLICYNVPIARTGMQEYLGKELNLEGIAEDEIKPVYRYPEDVFSNAAIASFEGKPVTDNHPQGKVAPDNISRYLKGVATNVRQGTGENIDKVLAELIIYDSILISEIEAGKREISCGYDCIYEKNEKGEICQRSIEGNHVAVVGEGRAGEKVAIKDEQPKRCIERSKKTMATKKKNSGTGVVSAVARMFPMFSKDTAPEEISDAVEALVDSITESQNDEEQRENDSVPQSNNELPNAQDSETEALVKQLQDTVQSLISRLDNAEAERNAQDDPLAKLEDELLGEESVTVPVEKMDDEEIQNDSEAEDNEQVTDIDGVVTPPSDRPENPIRNADRQAMLREIRTIKPVVAQIKDEKVRKTVSDSLARVYRQSVGMNTRDSRSNGYAGIMNAKQVKAHQIDAKNKTATVDDGQLGKEIAKKFNPHYKNR